MVAQGATYSIQWVVLQSMHMQCAYVDCTRVMQCIACSVCMYACVRHVQHVLTCDV